MLALCIAASAFLPAPTLPLAPAVRRSEVASVSLAPTARRSALESVQLRLDGEEWKESLAAGGIASIVGAFFSIPITASTTLAQKGNMVWEFGSLGTELFMFGFIYSFILLRDEDKQLTQIMIVAFSLFRALACTSAMMHDLKPETWQLLGVSFSESIIAFGAGAYALRKALLGDEDYDDYYRSGYRPRGSYGYGSRGSGYGQGSRGSGYGQDGGRYGGSYGYNRGYQGRIVPTGRNRRYNGRGRERYGVGNYRDY